jgi:hypothetical protein
MKTTEEWDEEYERNIHVDLPGRRRVGEPYREHIRQLETENDRLRKTLRKIAALDYRTAATTGAAYEAVRIARKALAEQEAER